VDTEGLERSFGNPLLGLKKAARKSTASCIQRLVSYLVRSTPSGSVRVSTRFRFTQLSRAVKNGVPPPHRADGLIGE